MLQNYLLKTKQLSLLFGCIGSLLFSACSSDPDIPQVMELTIEDNRNIADGIFNIIIANENYEVLNRDQYAEAYEYLDNSINSITDSDLLTHRNTYDWQVHIINNNQGTNAFATPGGYIYFDMGLLKTIGSEATFMHLLAHEISYADKGFVNKKLQDNYGLQLLLDLALGATVGTAEELLNTLYDQPFGVNHVKEADDFMLELACEKGYDAELLKWFLQNNSAIGWLNLHSTGDLDSRLNVIRDYECADLDDMNNSSVTYGEFLTKL